MSDWPAFPVVAGGGTWLTMRFLQVISETGAVGILINNIMDNPIKDNSSFMAAVVPLCLSLLFAVVTMAIYIFGGEINPITAAAIDGITVIAIVATMAIPQLKLNKLPDSCDSLKRKGWDGCALAILVLAFSAFALLFVLASIYIEIRSWRRQKTYRRGQGILDTVAARHAEEKFNQRMMHGSEPAQDMVALLLPNPHDRA